MVLGSAAWPIACFITKYIVMSEEYMSYDIKREEREFELSSQLHEQHAINQNSKQSLFVGLLIALFSSFGASAYVYIENKQQIFLFVYLVLGLVLVMLNALILHYGYAERRDQVVVSNISEKYYSRNIKSIFGDLYQHKKKGFCCFLPNFYSILFLSILVFQFIVFALAFEVKAEKVFWVYCSVSVLYIVVSAVCYLRARYNKYNKLFND